jgi:carotenoid 1,2-hydratase
VEVDLQQPRATWTGDAYLDSNERDEPMDRAFRTWDWARSVMRGGDTAVVYDVRPLMGPDRVIAQRFADNGQASPFEAPPRQAVPRSKWLIERNMRSEAAVAPRVERTLEDTPFYVRSVMQSGLLGELVTSVHETLDAQRVASLPVRLMLPWRMPRVS